MEKSKKMISFSQKIDIEKSTICNIIKVKVKTECFYGQNSIVYPMLIRVNIKTYYNLEIGGYNSERIFKKNYACDNVP